MSNVGRHITEARWQELDTTEAELAIKDAQRYITDAVVRRALRAYESLPTGTGREERMRVALAEVARKDL